MQNSARLALIATLVSSLALPVQAFDFGKFFGFGDSEEKKEPVTEPLAQAAQQLANEQGVDAKTLAGLVQNPLITQLTKGLNINPLQAAGGSAAMLTMAADKLGYPQNTELLELIPQIESITSLLPDDIVGKLKSVANVESAFSDFGLDPAMLTKFVPILISVLSELGANKDLTGQLAQIWK